MSEIISLKMLTGEEIVTELTGVQENLSTGELLFYNVRRPHVLQFQPMGHGQLGLAFVPWALSNPDIEHIEIPASSVIAKFSPADKVEKQYLQQTSSIEIASHI